MRPWLVLLLLLAAVAPAVAAPSADALLRQACGRLLGTGEAGDPLPPAVQAVPIAASIPLANLSRAGVGAPLTPDGAAQIFRIRRDLDPDRHAFLAFAILGRPEGNASANGATAQPAGPPTVPQADIPGGTPPAPPTAEADRSPPPPAATARTLGMVRFERLPLSDDDRRTLLPGDDRERWTSLHLIVPTGSAFGRGYWEGLTWAAFDATIGVLACPRAEGTPMLALDLARVSHGAPVLTLTLAALGLFYLGAGRASEAFRRSGGTVRAMVDPMRITQDEDGYGSLSRLQVFFFSLLVGGTTLYVALRAGFLSEISTELLALLGIAGAGTVAARVAGNATAPTGAAPDTLGQGGATGPQRLGEVQRRWLLDHELLERDRVGRWRDLLNTQGEFDVYKFQSILFSVLVGAAIVLAGVTGLASFKVPQNLLLLLGISQLVYVGGKAVLTRDCRALNLAVNAAIAVEPAAAAPGAAPADITAFHATVVRVREETHRLFDRTAPDRIDPRLWP